MQNRILVKECASHVAKSVTVAGWLHRLRNFSKFGFALLRDRSGIVQIVLTAEHCQLFQGLQNETIFSATGVVVQKPSRSGAIEYEIQADTIQIISPVTHQLPIEINKPEGIDANLDTILDNRVVSVRAPQIRAIFRVQAALLKGYRTYMDAQGFTECMFPILAGAASEGGSEFFKLDYFGRTATLTQSAQLYKQIMMAVYEGVYGISYSFRAEKFSTSRHLTEFNQLEFELGFIESQEELLIHAERAIRSMLRMVEEECKEELNTLQTTLPLLGENAFPRIDLSEALQIYKDDTGIDETNEPDLSPAAERWLSTEWAPQHHGTSFVFVTGWPEIKRPFYALPDPTRPGYTVTFDLIGNGSELASGGLRISNYEQQIERIIKKGLDPSDFNDYTMLHKYGIPPEGGFGLGLQRLTQNILKLSNIKEATLFPRDVQRLCP